MFLSTLLSPFQEASNPLIAKWVQDCIQAYKIEGNVDKVLNQASLNPELIHSIQIVSALMATLRDQIQGVKPLNPEAFLEVLALKTEEKPEEGYVYLALCQQLQSVVKLHQKNISGINEESPLAREARTIDELCASNFLSEPLVKLKHSYVYAQLTPTNEFKRVVAEHRNLALEKTGLDIGPHHNDSLNLKQMEHLKAGIYDMVFQANEKSDHAIVFIKTGPETYFWDPNFGLIDCQKHLQNTLQKLLKLYSPGDNHALELRRFSSI